MSGHIITYFYTCTLWQDADTISHWSRKVSWDLSLVMIINCLLPVWSLTYIV